jgi:hypothetical protein
VNQNQHLLIIWSSLAAVVQVLDILETIEAAVAVLQADIEAQHHSVLVHLSL